MLKVDNREAIHNLANKSFRANKTRNIIAIVAIALTTILFTSLFTMGIGTVENLQKMAMRQAGGDGHAVIKYMTDAQYDVVKENAAITEIAYDKLLCDKVENEALRKRHTEFWYYDEIGIKLGMIELMEGNMPQAENEVIVDSQTLQLLGVPKEIGATIDLDLNIRGENLMRSFVLSGWWESDPAFNVGQIFASDAYVAAHSEELQSTFYDDHYVTGAINAYIKFSNSANLEAKLEKLLVESGFSSDESDSNYIASNVNWSYLSTNFDMDAGTLLGLGSGLLLISLTGYLIIYNIFQISVVQDIRFYGLLKTIGTTKRQIHRIIRRQAILLSAIGIPIGLTLGFFTGRDLVPLLMQNSSYAGGEVSVSADPLIFICSALFSMMTVMISTYKPGQLAGKVSPIEAVRYTECDQPKYRQKKSVDGAKMSRMALSNIWRNRKRTLLVIISLALSVVLFNTVLTLSNGIDMDKLLGKFSDTDFLVAHADYFNNEYYGVNNEVSEQMIAEIEALEGFEIGGRLFGGRENSFSAANTASKQDYNVDKYGNFFSAVYGLEAFPMMRLDLIDGSLDEEKLQSGDYILEGVHLDDNGKIMMDTANYKVGDTVKLFNWRSTDPDHPEVIEYVEHTYTVLGHVAIKTYTNSDRAHWNYTFFLPAKVYQTIVDEPAVMSYVFDVADAREKDVEGYLKTYTTEIEPLMNYDSKATVAKSFEEMQRTVLFVGGALCAIIGLIGILNFMNGMLTSIVTRRKEFAMLQSIGMTRKQLKKMLCYEGLYYTGLSGIFSIVIGIFGSLIIVKALCDQMWFMTYHFIVWPLFISVPVLLVFGLSIPFVIYSITDKQSIVERLRESE